MEWTSGTDLNQLAYILYTSGSTGTPKGVMGTQRGIVNRISWMWREYPFAPDEVCCQPTSLNFVDAIAEIFGPLLQSVPLVVVPEETVRDPNLFVELLAAQRVTRLTLLPSLLAALLQSTADLSPLSRLTLWTCSGEPLDAELAREFYRRLPEATLLNLYGSSEAAADSTYFQVPRDFDGQRVPIGRPIANTQVYILDSAMEPTPIGVQGELYIGGAGLARGYVAQPALTDCKFGRNPFGDETSLVYRTGDRARYLADGNIEYLGRNDLQVKVRGMRVELGEIEAALRAHPHVRDAVVVLRAVTRGDERLVAYVETDAAGGELETELRAMLQQRLPAHMIPSLFMPLAQLPRTPGGKVDRRALPEPLQDNKLASTRAAPRDAVEAKLQTIWQRVLQVETVGVADDFFEMGGHSLLAIVLFGEIEREFGTRLPVATLFQAPTIEQLAPLLRQGNRTREWSPLIPIQPRGSKPIFFCLHGFGGGVVGYGQLARLLGDDQPFYGLQARGQEDEGEPDDAIEAMADRYLAAIRAKQATGPYYLGGYCYGGTVAYEVARKLVAQGDTVRFLGMFENPAPRSGYRHFKPTLQSTPRFIKNLPYWAGDFLALEWKLKWRRVEREVKQRAYFRRMQTMLSERELPPIDLRDVLDDVAPVPQKHQRLIQVHVGAMVRYQPQPYNGRVTVFRTRRQPLFCSHDPFLGWKALASEVEVHLVAGSHHNLLEEPHVESLARELSRALALARGEG